MQRAQKLPCDPRSAANVRHRTIVEVEADVGHAPSTRYRAVLRATPGTEPLGHGLGTVLESPHGDAVEGAVSVLRLD